MNGVTLGDMLLKQRLQGMGVVLNWLEEHETEMLTDDGERFYFISDTDKENFLRRCGLRKSGKWGVNNG